MILVYKDGKEKNMSPIIEEIAKEVQDDWQMTGLAEGIYLDFVKEVVKIVLMKHGNAESMKFR